MLKEHNITYRPRTSVKGQILADFLTEMLDESPPDASVVETQQEQWTLFTNRSSCVDGSGAGLILTSPKGTKFTYALRFQFAASNNEAEYEALIVNLWIAVQMGVQNVHISVDSKLVLNQVLETYVAKKENMIKYLEKVKSLVLVEILKEKSIQEKEEGGKQTPYQGSTVRIIRRGSLQAVISYAIAKVFRTTPSGLCDPKNSRGVIQHARGTTVYEEIISDNDKQFNDNPFKDWCDKFNITQRFASVKHPQSNGLVERANQSLGKGIKARLAVIPVEMECQHIAPRQPGDFVYRNNDASHAVDGGKLGSKREGSYEVMEALGDGAYKLRSADETVLPKT
nr:reverse transcriptase domain-containing protein [Tanacetum cinerariifolium]